MLMVSCSGPATGVGGVASLEEEEDAPGLHCFWPFTTTRVEVELVMLSNKRERGRGQTERSWGLS